MTEQSTALRLADRLESRWALHPDMQEAATELRRLHAENEALQKTKHYEASLWRLRRINADLMEALKEMLNVWEEDSAYGAASAEKARATIKKAEENT